MAPPEAGASWGGEWASFLLRCGAHRPPIRPESTGISKRERRSRHLPMRTNGGRMGG